MVSPKYLIMNTFCIILFLLCLIPISASSFELSDRSEKVLVIVSPKILGNDLEYLTNQLYTNSNGYYGSNPPDQKNTSSEIMQSEALLALARLRAQHICAMRNGESSVFDGNFSRYKVSFETVSAAPGFADIGLLFIFNCI